MALSSKIQALINYANETTRAGDTRLGDAVKTLCEGYGGGEEKPKWTGHVDEAGLRAIGWNDTDIAYFKANGLCWNEEEDDYYKVSQYIKDEYAAGKITYNNYRNYSNTMDYMPRISDGFTLTAGKNFQNFYYLKGVPCFDFQESSNATSAFSNCSSLLCMPPLYLPLALTLSGMFYKCVKVKNIQIIAPIATNLNSTFRHCYRLQKIDLTIADNVTNFGYAFQENTDLEVLPPLILSSGTTLAYFTSTMNCLRKVENLDARGLSATNLIVNGYHLEEIRNVRQSSHIIKYIDCYALRDVENFGPFATSFDLSYCQNLTHQSLVNIISELETVTTSQKLTLGAILLSRLTDSEKQAAINKGWTLA